MHKEYHKLVRDNIPRRMVKDGSKIKFEVLSDTNLYQLELKNRVLSELDALDNNQSIDNLADILEAVKALAELQGLSWTDVINWQETKRQVYGGFSGRMYLMSEDTI